MIHKPDDLTPEECEEAFAMFRIHKTKMAQIIPEELTKKAENEKVDQEGMNKVINLNIPDIGEKIFSSLDTDDLVKLLPVSKTWKELIENVSIKRIKRWRGKIYDACKDGQMEVVKLLLLYSDDEGEDLKWVFRFACENGHKDIVKLMLGLPGSKHIGLNFFPAQKTPFIIAYEKGHQDVVKILLNHPRSQDIDLVWVFRFACHNGHTDIVKLMLDLPASKDIGLNFSSFESFVGYGTTPAGVSPNRTPFMMACEKGHKDVVKILLDHPRSQAIDLNFVDFKRTPFMMACEKGHKDVVEILLDHPRSQSIDLNFVDSTFKNQQWNSFMLACYFGKKDVVKLLLDHPRSQTIDFKAKDSNGDDAITITTKRGLKSLAQFLENHPKMKDL